MAEPLAPAPVDAVELEKVGGRRGAAAQLVDVGDVEARGGARIAVLAPHPAERRPQRQPPDAPHAVDADPHG